VVWQLQTAKQKLSELIERALADGPQIVTRRGRPVVVVVSLDEYRRMRGVQPDFKRFLRTAPDLDLLALERAKDPPRTPDL
jgi:prevent-host-death family protein